MCWSCEWTVLKIATTFSGKRFWAFSSWKPIQHLSQSTEQLSPNTRSSFFSKVVAVWTGFVQRIHLLPPLLSKKCSLIAPIAGRAASNAAELAPDFLACLTSSFPSAQHIRGERWAKVVQENLTLLSLDLLGIFRDAGNKGIKFKAKSTCGLCLAKNRFGP